MTFGCLMGLALTINNLSAAADTDEKSKFEAKTTANLVRNGSFERPFRFNGAVMRLSKYDVANTILQRQKKNLWDGSFAEGWWLKLPKPKSADIAIVNGASDANKAVQLTGNGSLRSDYRALPPATKVATLSFDIKTQNARGFAELTFIKDHKDMFEPPVVARQRVEIPRNTDGKFVRISTTLSLPEQVSPSKKLLLAGCSFDLQEGSVTIDAVQIETSREGTPFRPRREEWLTLKMSDFPAENIPRYYAQKTDVKTIEVMNSSGRELSGTLNVYVDKWNEPGKTLLKSIVMKSFKPNTNVTAAINPDQLEPDAYIVLAELVKGNEKLISFDGAYDVKYTASGTIGQHMLRAYNAMRICVFPPGPVRDVVGIGNYTITVYQQWAGYNLENFTLGREAGLVQLSMNAMNEEAIFFGAVAGAQFYAGAKADKASRNKEYNNPALRNAIDVFNPHGYKEVIDRAEKLGKFLAIGPGVNTIKLRNESPYINRGAVCPTEAADKDFRNWCKKRYKTLETVNKNWLTNYKSWDEVEQIVSAKMLAQSKTTEKTGAANVDWFANMGRLNPNSVKQMRDNPGRAMDWLRWRTDSSLRVYGAYIQTAKQYTKDKVLYGENMCWPNFWPQMAMRFYRFSDAPMMDMQYTAGHSIDLGNSDEMIDMLEMAESTVPDKPLWGIEIYLQPTFPDDFPALQNWGMLAHGTTANLTFGWKPYSDRGPRVFKDGNKAWEKKNAPPMWMLIDTDGTKLPLWYSNLKSAREIAAFHEKHDVRSLQRVNSRAGWYVSPDTAELAVMLSGNKPYNSPLTQARICQAAQLRMQGVTMNYLDDESLKAISVANFDSVLVPPTPVLSDEAAARLAEFVKAGGTLVLLGPAGAYDPWLNKRECFGGEAWKELNWHVPAQWKDLNSFMEDFGGKHESQLAATRNYPVLNPEQVLKDKTGQTMASVKHWGKGKVIATSVYPRRYTRLAHPTKELYSYMQWLKTAAGLPVTGVWLPEASDIAREPAKIGSGAPLVEVVVREKNVNGKTEKFVFVLNQGGSGKGTVCVPVKPGIRYNAIDALTGEKIEANSSKGFWKLDLQVSPWQYNVIRLY